MSSTVPMQAVAQAQNGLHNGTDQRAQANNQWHDIKAPAEQLEIVAKAPMVIASRSATCDRCNERIDGVRYKCQHCPDFDYCKTCVRLASAIHPGHEFVPLRGADSLSDEEALQARLSIGVETLHASTFRLIGRDTSMPATLCISCQPVTMPLPAIGTILKDEQVRSQGKNNLQLRWPARISKLVEATVGGCAFCSFVLHKFFGPGNGIMFGYEPDTPWECQPDSSMRKDVIAHAMHLLTLMRSDKFVFVVEPVRGKGLAESDVSRLRIELKEAKQDKEVLDRALASRGQQYVELDVYAAGDNPAADLITTRPPNPSPASPRALRREKLWLFRCEQEHGEACAPQQTPLPTRLIDVSDRTKLRLRESTAGSTGRYIALSYCWGEAQSFQTTKESLNDRLDGFNLIDVPQTLQDAVAVARTLGIDYLWVDSMCILQDDATDRASEIKGMASIYKHATLTITASKADSVTKGFLEDGADSETGLWKNLIPLAFPIPDPAANSISEAFQMPRKVFGTAWLCDENHDMVATFRSPVDRRSWCLQERLLSSRNLTYGRWPTWSCTLGTYSDGGFYPHNPKQVFERQLTKCLAERRWQAGSGSQAVDMHTSTQLLQSWYKLLNEYTQRELGVKSDRLPAIGGIAAEISRATGFPYLAGLWQPNLLHDLMWYAQTKEWLTRPKGYTGPTWSWASVDCPVNYDNITEDALALASVIDCSVEAGASGSFGEVHSGRMEIEGLFLHNVEKEDVVALIRDQNMADPPPQSNDVQEWYRQIMEHISNQARNDKGQGDGVDGGEKWEDSLFSGREVSVLLTFSREWRVKNERRVEGTFCSGLLLRKVDSREDACYERIGAFVNEDRAWLDKCQSQETGTWERKRVVLV